MTLPWLIFLHFQGQISPVPGRVPKFPKCYCILILKGCLHAKWKLKGTEDSFLLSCPSLPSTRQALIDSMNYLLSYPDLLPMVCECLSADLVKFRLDYSTMPKVNRAVQEEGGEILFVFFNISRNYCHSKAGPTEK